jgi:hypothetical protein
LLELNHSARDAFFRGKVSGKASTELFQGVFSPESLRILLDRGSGLPRWQVSRALVLMSANIS